MTQDSIPRADRPTFPEGYGLPSSTEGMLAWADVEARLAAATCYWLATVRPDGRPHVVPRWGVWLDGRFWYDGAPTTVHVRNLTANPACSLNLENGTQAVIVEGESLPTTHGPTPSVRGSRRRSPSITISATARRPMPGTATVADCGCSPRAGRSPGSRSLLTPPASISTGNPGRTVSREAGHDPPSAGHGPDVGISATNLDDRFRTLYSAHFSEILGYALRRVAAPEDAADVVAETFLTAWRRRDDVPPDEEGRLWLYGVARRVLANHLRGEGRRSRLGDRLRIELADQLTVHDPADEVVQIWTVRSAMALLDTSDREVLELTVWEQLAPREIAVALGLSSQVVRARLSRARARLRVQLDAGHDPLDAGHDPGASGHVQSVRPVLVSEEEK